jgi:hypothetical protein
MATAPLNIESIQAETALIVAEGTAIQIKDQETYNAATSFLTEKLNPRIKAIDEFFDANIASAHALHKSLLEQKRVVSTPVAELKKKFNTAIIHWDDAREAERLEAQRRADEEQRKQDEEARLQTAVEVEALGGSEEELAQVLATPAITTAPVVAPTYQKASGVATKVSWRAEIKGEADGTTFEKSMRALCLAIGKGEQPVQYVEPNLTALNQIARAQTTAMNIPGVKAVSNKSVASKSRG